MSIELMWAEKYRPTTFDSFIFQDENQKKQFQAMVKNKEIPHLLLTGSAGQGKSTMSNMLVELLEIDPMDVLYVNASKNNSVEFIRDTIDSFATTFAMGSFKIVQLEEADMLTINAQTVLKDMLEQTQATCRFIFTCNAENKLIEPIKSRLQRYHFKAPPKDEMIIRCGEILVNENIEFDVKLLEKYVDTYYPDMRKTINALQKNSVGGTLSTPTTVEASGDWQFKSLDLIESGDLKALRKLICESVQREEYDSVYRFLYENIHKSKKFSKQEHYEQAIVTIASYLYKNTIVADPEINFAACAIEMSLINS